MKKKSYKSVMGLLGIKQALLTLLTSAQKVLNIFPYGKEAATGGGEIRAINKHFFRGRNDCTLEFFFSLLSCQ